MPRSERSRGGLILGALAVGSLAVLAVLKGIDSGNRSRPPEEPAADAPARTSPVREASDLESAPSSREPIVVAAPPSAEAPPVASFAHPTGDLVITVLAGDTPADSGLVQLYFIRNSRLRTQEVDKSTGAAVFPSLPPGDYYVQLENIPKGVLLPRVLRRSGPDNRLVVHVRPGRNTFDVVLEKPARIVGTVIEPDGRSSPTGVAQFSSLDDGPLRAPGTSLQISAGKFEGDLYPGVWAVDVRRGYQAAQRELGTTAQVVRLEPGTTTRVALEYPPPGTGAVSGRIADERGDPFGGLRIQGDLVSNLRDLASGREFEVTTSFVCLSSSGPDGQFRLEHLQTGRYRVYVERNGFHPFEQPEPSRIGSPLDPVVVEVFDGQETHVDVRARRPRRVRVRGKIEIGPAGLAVLEGSAPAPALNLTAYVGPPAEEKKALVVEKSALSFDFVIEAGSPDPRLVLTLGDATSVYLLQIPADGELEPLLLRLP
jgi:hypothetical protein